MSMQSSMSQSPIPLTCDLASFEFSRQSDPDARVKANVELAASSFPPDFKVEVSRYVVSLGTTDPSNREHPETVRYTLVRVDPEAAVALITDDELFSRGISTDGGTLINQSKTTTLLDGRPAGVAPETLAAHIAHNNLDSALIGYLCHAGWQTSEFLVKNGGIVRAGNADDPHQTGPTGSYSVIGKVVDRPDASPRSSWTRVDVDLVDGVPSDPSPLEQMEIGFSAPLLVSNGALVPPDTYLSYERLLADPRNVLDLSFGCPTLQGQEKNDFFLHIRKVLPLVKRNALSALSRGDAVTLEGATDLTNDEAVRLNQILEANPDLGRKLSIELLHEGTVRVSIGDSIPHQRIPVIGVGVTERGELLVVCADGRQPDLSRGPTIAELGTILQGHGAIHGAIGSAGNDALLRCYHNGDPIDISSPSGGGMRPMPAIFVVHQSRCDTGASEGM